MSRSKNLRPAFLIPAACLALLAASAPAWAVDARPPPAAPIRASAVWLGVQMADGDAGVVVRHVVRTSPADKAGIRDGDVILTVEKMRVARAQDVTAAVALHASGDSVVVGLKRGDRTLDVTAQLEARPSPEEVMNRDLVGTFAPAWGDVAPLSGAPASMASLKGRVVVLDFWASFCGPCRYMAPELGALDNRYRAQGLTVVGMTTDAPDAAATTRERWGMRYGIVVDKDTKTHQAYGVSALPTMVVIDRKGVIRHVSIGASPSEVQRLDGVIRTLLAEP